MHSHSSRDSVSVVGSSLCEAVILDTPTFCVVCGRFGNDFVLRNSGLKCTGCVGKSANKHWVRLQHRQANELLSQATARARAGSVSLLPSARDPRWESSTMDSDELPSQLTDPVAPVEAGEGRRSTVPSRRPSAPPIGEYIANTAVYMAAAAGWRGDALSSAPSSANEDPALPDAPPLSPPRTRAARRRAPAPPPRLSDRRPPPGAEAEAELALPPLLPPTETDRLPETPRADDFMSLPVTARRAAEASTPRQTSPQEAMRFQPASSSAATSSRGPETRDGSRRSSVSESLRPIVPAIFALSKVASAADKRFPAHPRVVSPVMAIGKAPSQPVAHADPESRLFSRSDMAAVELASSSSSSGPSSGEGENSPKPTPLPAAPMPHVHLDRLYVVVDAPFGVPLPEESPTATASTIGVRRVSSGGKEGGAVTPTPVPSAPGSKFTVTRHFSSAHQRQDSTGSLITPRWVVDQRLTADGATNANAGGGARRRRGTAPNGGSAHPTTGAEALEAKKLAFTLTVRDRDTHAALHSVERRYYIDLAPTFEELKSIMHSLPAVPSRRVPSTRHVTEAFVSERRVECQAFLDAVVQNHFLIRHPKVVELLRLDGYLQAEQQRSDAQKQEEEQKQQQQPPLAPPPQAPQPFEVFEQRHQQSAGILLRSSFNHPAGSAAPLLTSRASRQSSVLLHLNADALDRLRPTSSHNLFNRQTSNSSCLSTTSSVARRGEMDAVCSEDLQRVQLGNLIGRGTFGSVYLGLLPGSSTVVAVKVVRVNENVDEDFLISMRKELDVLRAARHKNIIRFLGSAYLEHERELRVFTEYVECGNISTMVKKFGSLPLLVIQRYMTEIMRGLNYLHTMAIVHRDIKGENILITKRGRCKLADFGCSGALHEMEGGEGIHGSPQWMAPEIIHGASSAASGDVWALGCVGIEMLQREIWNIDSGINPYIYLYRVGKSNRPPDGLPTEEELETFNKDNTREEYECFALYRDFLGRCLRMNPEERWPVSELLKHPFLHTPFSKHLRWSPPTASSRSS